MKQVGDKVHINGKEYTLGEEIGGGLEGKVFNVLELPKYAIKIISTANKSDNEIKKLRDHLNWLKDVVGQNEELKAKMALPKALLDDDFGYVMLKVNSKECSSVAKYLEYPKEQQLFFEWCKNEYNLKKRLQICANLFRTLERMHISGILFTDISPNNIMIHKTQNGLVFIDTDNTRRRSDPYVHVLGTEGYMAPEMFLQVDDTALKKAKELRIDEEIFKNSAKISTESDVFAAAIIAFQLLTLQHPFVGDKVENGTADEETLAYRCQTDYILKEATSNNSSQPFIKYFDNCTIITPKLKMLFEAMFVEGKSNASFRPTAMDMFEAFDECIDLLTTCPYCGVSRINANVPTENETKDIECWYCEKKWETPLSLKIYNDYVNSNNREEIVNAILSEQILENESKEKSRFFVVSEIVLNEKEPKYLYLRHFENVSQRSKPYAVIELKDSEAKMVEFTFVDTNSISDCYLVEKGNKDSLLPMKVGKAFRYDRYYILFEIKDTRIGKIRTIGCFYSRNMSYAAKPTAPSIQQQCSNVSKSEKIMQLADRVIQLAEKVYKMDSIRISKSEIFNNTYGSLKKMLACEDQDEYASISGMEPDYSAIVQRLKQWK